MTAVGESGAALPGRPRIGGVEGHSVASGRRARSREPEQTGSLGTEYAVELSRLTKRYGSVVGVEGLTLDVRAGEVFGFLGPNGAGKTTALRCLTGLLRPTEGRVRVWGWTRSRITAARAGWSDPVRRAVRGVCSPHGGIAHAR